MDPFPAICDIVLAYEGGFSAVSSDPGNWTGGAVGVGTLNGTNYGISAASFPTLNIRALTQTQAIAIYRALYWGKIQGPALPAPLGLLVFDAAVNNGVSAASRMLQASVGVEQDGILGTQTMTAVAKAASGPGGVTLLCTEFQARRTDFMGGLSTWSEFGLGWARRLCGLLFQATTFADDQADAAPTSTASAAPVAALMPASTPA